MFFRCVGLRPDAVVLHNLCTLLSRCSNVLPGHFMYPFCPLVVDGPSGLSLQPAFEAALVEANAGRALQNDLKQQLFALIRLYPQGGRAGIRPPLWGVDDPPTFAADTSVNAVLAKATSSAEPGLDAVPQSAALAAPAALPSDVVPTLPASAVAPRLPSTGSLPSLPTDAFAAAATGPGAAPSRSVSPLFSDAVAPSPAAHGPYPSHSVAASSAAAACSVAPPSGSVQSTTTDAVAAPPPPAPAPPPSLPAGAPFVVAAAPGAEPSRSEQNVAVGSVAASTSSYGRPTALAAGAPFVAAAATSAIPTCSAPPDPEVVDAPARPSTCPPLSVPVSAPLVAEAAPAALPPCTARSLQEGDVATKPPSYGNSPPLPSGAPFLAPAATRALPSRSVPTVPEVVEAPLPLSPFPPLSLPSGAPSAAGTAPAALPTLSAPSLPEGAVTHQPPSPGPPSSLRSGVPCVVPTAPGAVPTSFMPLFPAAASTLLLPSAPASLPPAAAVPPQRLPRITSWRRHIILADVLNSTYDVKKKRPGLSVSQTIEAVEARTAEYRPVVGRIIQKLIGLWRQRWSPTGAHDAECASSRVYPMLLMAAPPVVVGIPQGPHRWATRVTAAMAKDEACLEEPLPTELVNGRSRNVPLTMSMWLTFILEWAACHPAVAQEIVDESQADAA